LATFLAAFFFFFAMEMAPCHEHPVRITHPLPRMLLAGEQTTLQGIAAGDHSPAALH
jgi:hypothetical protein